MDLDNGTEGSSLGCDQKFGAGLLQVKNALDFLDNNPCDGASWGQSLGDGGCDILDH